MISAIKHATDPQQTVLQRYAYAYDPAGNRTVEQIADAVTLSTYDNLNRLTSQTPGGPIVVAGTLNEPGTVTISGVPAVVDANDAFRGAVPTTSGTNTFTVLATDASGNTTTQQYQLSVVGGSKTFTYDANGNLSSDGTRAFGWDARNQLVSVTIGTKTTEFSYDGLKFRATAVQKVSGAVTAQYKFVRCDAESCEQRDNDGAAVSSRALNHGESTGGMNHFFVGDHLGNVAAITNTVPTVVATYVFDPYGRRTVASGSDVVAEGFTGHQWHDDGEVALAFFRAYDPGMGRWISEDPIRLMGGINFYGYVAGNPIVNRDPYGLAIHCSVRSYSERLVGGNCPAGAGACTHPLQSHIASDCTQDEPCGEWSFDGRIYMSYRVDYLQNKNAKAADGKTYQEHEWSHIDDYQRWCSSMNQLYKSEGFTNQAACEAARRYFMMDTGPLFNMATTATKANRDNK